MKSMHVHVTASQVTYQLMEGCSREDTCYKALPLGWMDPDGSLIVISRTSAWEVLHVFCLMEMSRLMEVLCLRK